MRTSKVHLWPWLTAYLCFLENFFLFIVHKTLQLFTSSFTLSFPKYCISHTFSLIGVLTIPKYSPSTQKSVKQFGYSFAFEAALVSNSFQVDFCSFPTHGTFRGLESDLFSKAYQPLAPHTEC